MVPKKIRLCHPLLRGVFFPLMAGKGRPRNAVAVLCKCPNVKRRMLKMNARKQRKVVMCESGCAFLPHFHMLLGPVPPLGGGSGSKVIIVIRAGLGRPR